MEYKPTSNTAVDEAVSRLRAEILAGDYGVGCLPYREDMARRYGTSVYVVDQAIRRLLDEGLLILKKKRVFVAGTSWQATIQASRIALEQSRQTTKTNEPVITPTTAQSKQTTRASEPMIIPTSLGEMPFYVYTLSYPEGFLAPDGQELGGTVFYVGKGTVQPPSLVQRVDIHEWEALRPSSHRPDLSINQYTINAIRQIWKQGKLVVKQIIFESEDEREVLAHERRALKQFASPYLTNYQRNPFVNQRISHSPNE